MLELHIIIYLFVSERIYRIRSGGLDGLEAYCEQCDEECGRPG